MGVQAEYALKVTAEDGSEWAVSKRYSEMSDFRHTMLCAQPSNAPPALTPPRRPLSR